LKKSLHQNARVVAYKNNTIYFIFLNLNMKLRCQSFSYPASFLLFLAVSSPLQAQITGDQTLRNSSTVTTEDANSIITGGTQTGSNLYHSFSEFSVPTNGIASFQDVAPEIENVITRVTGAPSNIDGLIEVLQPNGAVSSANFFLLNPKGITFSSNASLNIGGSFIVSTASSLHFADNTQFSTDLGQIEPLLSMNVPVGLQFGVNPGRLLNQSQIGLQILPSKTLALVGGDVVLEGGFMIAPAGRIELGSVASSSFVSLNPTNSGWSLGYTQVQNFQNVKLSQGSIVDVSGEANGNIQIQGKQVAIADGSFIIAAVESQHGGEIFIHASDLTINSSLIGTRTDNGIGANVTIATGKLLIINGQVLAETLGEGHGGELNITASESVKVVGGFQIPQENGDFEYIPSGLLTRSDNNATGAAGNLSLTTNRLIIQDGAQIGSVTVGAGNTGNVTVRASEIEVVGIARTPEGEPISDAGLPFPSGLFASAEEGSSGNGGNLEVTTDRLSIRDGAVVQTTTFGSGDAGNLTIQEAQSIEVAGTVNVEGENLKSGLFANSGGLPGTGLPAIFDATGRGGNLKIQTDELIVRDGAIVAVSSVNETPEAQGAGTLQVDAQTIRLDNGEIVANTASGEGGNINLNVQDLFLRRSSEISTTAGIEGAGGNGGDISINNARFIIAAPNENNDIKANAFLGQGGKVTIDAQNIFGLIVRSLEDLQTLLGTSDPAQLDPVQLSSSDITAISQTNPELSGEVVINTPDVDPSRGAVVLPQNLVDVSGLIAQGCAAENVANESQFVVTGRGGLPPNPGEVLNSDDVWQDWRFSDATTGITEAIAPTFRNTSTPLVEATNWATNNKGEIMLIAATPTTTINPGQNVISCQ
jgi:filamentous hemagglutinin family protein